MLKEVTSKIYPTSTVASKFARFKHRGLHWRCTKHMSLI